MTEPTLEPEVWRAIYLTELLTLLPADKVHWAKIFADGHMFRDRKTFRNPKVQASFDQETINIYTERELNQLRAAWPTEARPDMRIVDNSISYYVALGHDDQRISDPYHGRLNAENRLMLLQERAKVINKMIDEAFKIPLGCADWGKK